MQIQHTIKKLTSLRYFILLLIVGNMFVVFIVHRRLVNSKTSSYASHSQKVKMNHNRSTLIDQQNRLRIFNEKCQASKMKKLDIQIFDDSPLYLMKTYSWLKTALFPVQSQSMMYCATPKVASKILISFTVYLYIRDNIQPMKNQTILEQHVNVSKLIEEFKKV